MNLRSLALLALLALPVTAFAANRDDAELSLATATTAIDAAQNADAPRYANIEFNAAQQSLAFARSNYDRRDWEDVILAAEKARADADLAAARSRQHRAEAATAEIDATIASLRTQLGITGG
jgi:hypothetical protein